jgi:hypothetical protein
LRVQFKNEHFFRRERPHKVFRRDLLNVGRSRKAAENDARRKKGLLLNGHELEGRQMQQKQASIAKDTINEDTAAMDMGKLVRSVF